MLAALRLGLYELLYLGGSPDYAVVADAVELAKAQGRAGHGLVNAVLRRAAREGARRCSARSATTRPSSAAVKHSHPEWIARLWWEELGAEQAPRADGARQRARRAGAARQHARHATPRALARARCGRRQRTATRGIPEALVLEEPFDVHGSPLWRAGAFIAQSRAAMLVARTLAPRPGERVLDLCAAPGGKSTHLAALMDGERRGRRRRARTRAGPARSCAPRSGCARGNVRVEVADAAPAAHRRAAIRPRARRPALLGAGHAAGAARPALARDAGAIAEMARRTGRILAAGAGALRPGGVLVYSTCTISPTENERLIAAFLDSHPDFALDDLAAELPDSRSRRRCRRAPSCRRGLRADAAPPRPHRRLLHRAPAQELSDGGRARRARPRRRSTSGPQCPNCGEPWLRPTNLPGRYRCVYCLHRFELTSVCPNCGEHSTIVRMSSTAILKCNNCGDSMLQAV